MAHELRSPAGSEAHSEPATPKTPQTLLYALLAGIGVPTLAATIFHDQVGRHPVPAVAWLIMYELVVGVVGFVRGTTGEASKDLQKRWGGRLADLIDTQAGRRLSGYGPRYSEHLVFRHRNFDVKGLSTQGPYNLDLERVFVSLSIVPQPPQDVSPNPVRPAPPSLPTDRRTIWNHLNTGGENGQNLVIIGAPGSGKTTLLKHMALMLAGRTKQRQTEVPRKLPILLFLRDHAEKIKENADFLLAQAVKDSITKFNGPAPPPGWFEAALAGGQCLVMLDGLDEIADADIRKGVVTWVETQMVAHGRNAFVVTSRPFGYKSNPLSGVSVLEVCPFSREQQEQFVRNWYLANEIKRSGKDDPGVRMEAGVAAQDLLKRLQSNAALSELAVNPLLLTMIATVHCYRSALPGRRVELYDEICKVCLGTFQQARGITPRFHAGAEAARAGAARLPDDVP